MSLQEEYQECQEEEENRYREVSVCLVHRQYNMSVGFTGSTEHAKMLKLGDIAAIEWCAGGSNAEQTQCMLMKSRGG
jgi:hypothetical protein